MADIDPERYRTSIEAALPQIRATSLRVLGTGFHSIALETGNGLVLKFPRSEEAAAALVREAAALKIVQPAVSLRVPDLRLAKGSPPFSWHEKLPGEHLLAEHYEDLDAAARKRLALDLAGFYAQLHRLDVVEMEGQGIGPIAAWQTPQAIIERALPLLPAELFELARSTLAAFEALPFDPHGIVYGFFDGHGWNMAFDHEAGRLNGIYDFADSGLGPLHLEFVPSSLISHDLTARIVDAYEEMTGKALDRRRIDILTGLHRLSDLAELAHDPDGRDMALHFVQRWARERAARVDC